jgi:dTDP-4-dehydrorhamnose 3,5-epimerase
MPFSFQKLSIPDVVLVRPEIFQDDRGRFAEDFKLSAFREQGIGATFVQHNHSVSRRNVLRGLHYQLEPAAQGKLIRVISGEIYDVAVDLRQRSDHFGRWVGRTLSANTDPMMYIPAGFAHGFCVIGDEAEVIYYCTAEYAPELERGIVWNDSDLAIDWPVDEPILSDKDKGYPGFKQAEHNFT